MYNPNNTLATLTINTAASKVLSAREETSSSVDWSHPSAGTIVGLVWFGIIGTGVLLGFLTICCSICTGISCSCDCCGDCCNDTCKLVSNMAAVVFSPVLLLLAGILWVWKKTLKSPLERYNERKRQERIERNCRGIELRNRGYTRDAWARDELALAEKDGRRPNLPLLLIHNLEGGFKQMQIFRFEELPAELRLQVYSELDYGTALRLARVSKFFYYDRPANGVDKEQRATWVYHAETFVHNSRRKRLACYGCLRVRESEEFERQMRTEDFERFAYQELERKCFDCRIKEGAIPYAELRKLLRYVKKSVNGVWRNKRRR